MSEQAPDFQRDSPCYVKFASNITDIQISVVIFIFINKQVLVLQFWLSGDETTVNFYKRQESLDISHSMSPDVCKFFLYIRFISPLHDSF